ncbi:MAG TPA: 3'(2'),5'-bisphosphate nucleotidase CysQ, partial [Terriglobales bacterium]|nr:3'(2'),5'-bisphosphate nucleotidase CysQ [Terriglobales bacterium]
MTAHSAESAALPRIEAALDRAATVLSRFTPGAVDVEYKAGHDPVTEADRAVNEALHAMLLQDGEGWLSEETADNLERLNRQRLWVVDPLDGTREFVQGIPEWCVSIAWVQDGEALAGGILNPATGETFLGSRNTGVKRNGVPVQVSPRKELPGALVLGSRSEFKRGEWKQFQDGSLVLRPVGSVAYKLALVAAGLADATWTLVPKHEWDVAAGTALVQAAGGVVRNLDGTPVTFNSRKPWLPGLIAAGPSLFPEISRLLKVQSP